MLLKDNSDKANNKGSLPIPEENNVEGVDLSNFNKDVLNLPERKWYKEKIRSGSKKWFRNTLIKYLTGGSMTVILFYLYLLHYLFK